MDPLNSELMNYLKQGQNDIAAKVFSQDVTATAKGSVLEEGKASISESVSIPETVL